ncbi:MAG TPA: hypothetical protein PK420_02055, partial [Rubrivivax sp.]|nr:hypothetical protein [Rubrivivax sp.]
MVSIVNRIVVLPWASARRAAALYSGRSQAFWKSMRGSLSYLAGTFVCRRWIVRHGIRGAVARGGGF